MKHEAFIAFLAWLFLILACKDYGKKISGPEYPQIVVRARLYWEIDGGITEGADLNIRVGQQAKMVAVFDARPSGTFTFKVYEADWDPSGDQLITDDTVPPETVSTSAANVEQDGSQYKLSVWWTAVFQVGEEIVSPDQADYYFTVEQDGQVLRSMLEDANARTDNKVAPLLNVDNVELGVGEAAKKDRILEVLFRLGSGEADAKTNHDYNDYGNCPPMFNCDKDTGFKSYRGGHSGWDVENNVRNARFYSLTAGEIVNVSDLNTIAIYDATNRKTTVYLHASEVEQSIKDKAESTQKGSVRVGDFLGRQGEKGVATGPHVHIEVREGKTNLGSFGAGATDDAARKNPSIDPIDYLYESVQEAK